MSVAENIKNYLIEDIVSLDPAVVSAYNPSDWAMASDVPEYAYKCLAELVIGSGATSSQLEERINYKFGDRDTKANSKFEIGLYVVPMESARSKEKTNRDNTAGAETAQLNVILRANKQESSVKKMEQVATRIKYLIENQWRNERHLALPLYVEGDKGIRWQSGILCSWLEDGVEITSAEAETIYSIAYQRIAPRFPRGVADI